MKGNCPQEYNGRTGESEHCGKITQATVLIDASILPNDLHVPSVLSNHMTHVEHGQKSTSITEFLVHQLLGFGSVQWGLFQVFTEHCCHCLACALR